ncbi:MAG: peptidoglycan bridge formation glycyltransferase FemA/FemB family protein [Candidatus Methanoperedens sp.]|nr:peptidoglycan bridge formation glycyltransferase FemA/FemB family protein [Candidatus Methanoperedens sp.]
MTLFNLTTTLSGADWSEFVLKNPIGTIFHTPQMKDVYIKTKGYQPILLAVTDNSGNILALVNAVLMKEKSKFLEAFSARSIIFGGPIFENTKEGQEAVLFLMGEYEKVIGKQALYSEIRNIYDMSEFNLLFNQSGYFLEDHLNYITDLKRSEKEVWSDVHRSMRKNITKAQKNGILVKEVIDRNQVKIFYNFLKETYRNAKKPIMDLSYFEAIFDILVPMGMAKFHLAEYKDNYIGGRATLMYKNVIYAHYVSTSSEYKNLNPNALLNWEIISWGIKNGYHVFDFGGAGSPKEEYGVREFKKQFGGQLVNYGRYKKIHSPIKTGIADLGFKVYRHLK